MRPIRQQPVGSLATMSLPASRTAPIQYAFCAPVQSQIVRMQCISASLVASGPKSASSSQSR